MADVTPFKAMRYRADIALDDVVAPPYDVLSAAQAAELRARSPYNVVHVDLPVPPGEKADDAAYARAARTLRRWRADGVLVRDLKLPSDCTLAAVDVITVRGDTRLEAGDEVLAVVASEQKAALEAILGRKPQPPAAALQGKRRL